MKDGALRATAVHWRERARIAREGLIDTWRTIRWSSRVDSAFSAADKRSLECQMTKDYHRVEKGLALAAPRQPFGEAVLKRLTAGNQRLPAGSALSDHVYTAAGALATWNSSANLDEEVAPRLATLESTGRVVFPSDEWFTSRHSMRNFSTETLPELVDIMDAIGLASRSTPSVCNRQAWHAYLSTDPAQVKALLGFQNGNAGFRNSVPAVVVITASRQLFAGAGERHQMYVDGALFAMSAAWVLHARGLSTCMLNWSMTNGATAKLRAAVGANSDEEVITMMAVGYPSESARVARSPRRRLEEVVHVVE